MRDALPNPIRSGEAARKGVVLRIDEVLELGGTAVRPVDDVVPVNP
jgi:hypothetical protein